MRTLIVLALGVVMQQGVAVAERPAGPRNIVWHAEYAAAYRQMQAEQRPMLVFIKSNACVFCQRMEAQTYSHPLVIDDVAKGFVPAVVNSAVDPTLARRLGVRVFPTTVIISAEGKIVDKIPGFMTADEFRSRLRTAMVR